MPDLTPSPGSPGTPGSPRSPDDHGSPGTPNGSSPLPSWATPGGVASAPPARQTPRLTIGVIVFFCALATAAAALTALFGSYGYGLLLLTVAAALSSFCLFLGGVKILAGLLPFAAGVALSLLLNPARFAFALFIAAFAGLSGAIALAARQKCNRTQITARAGGALALLLAAGLLAYIAVHYGGIGSGALAAFRDDQVANFTAVINEANDFYREQVTQMGGDNTSDLLAALPLEGEVEQTVQAVTRVLTTMFPGLLIALCLVLAHFSSFLFIKAAKYFNKFAFSSKEDARVRIALPGAILYYVGGIALLFGGENVVATSLANLFLLYIPGFCAVGLRMLFPSKDERRGPPLGCGCLPVLLLMMVFLNPVLLPILLSLLGASSTVGDAIRRWREKNNK